jgi:hypothetical protein
MNMVVTTFVLVCLQSVVSVKEARDAYFGSSKGEIEASKFEKLLDSVGDAAAPVLICYKGASEMMKAKNAINPISKYSFFKRGKVLIETGLTRDSSSVESHFIRFSIQRNLPGFLGYNRNIVQDSLLIDKMLPDLQDNDLKFRITEYFTRLRAGNKNQN